MDPKEISNSIYELAASFVNSTDKHIFLTGRAGSGKTTFLKNIAGTTSRIYVVVAPTGVAAINAGGVTMHSFFQLPLTPFIPAGNTRAGSGEEIKFTPNSAIRNIRFNRNKLKLLKSLELLIIDEISMVRADMLDAVDNVLRYFRKRSNESFGGVQVLMIGDLFQLPPVVPAQEQELLRRFYSSHFFFDAHVLKESPPVCIELNRIFRQKDQKFISLLNRIRNNSITDEELALLNERYNPEFQPPTGENYITLTSHNHIADRINQDTLNKLPGKPYQYQATIEGEFNERSFPADKTLRLKEGAQIMFIKNDRGEARKYFNGKIGIIKKINPEGIGIAFPGEHEEFLLTREEWKNVRYSFNEKQKQIEENVLGVFQQYPIRLAWAVTIHKSQGLTFDKAIVDAGSSFTAGQVYVALSRLTSIDGLVLNSRIRMESIYCDQNVLKFMQEYPEEEKLYSLLNEAQKTFINKTLLKCFDWQEIVDIIQEHIESYKERKVSFRDEAVKEATSWLRTAQDQKEVAGRFLLQLNQILSSGSDDYSHLHNRVESANKYFSTRLKEELAVPAERHKLSNTGKPKMRKYLKAVQVIQDTIAGKITQLRHAEQLSEGLKDKRPGKTILNEIENYKKTILSGSSNQRTHEKKSLIKGESKDISLKYFNEGMAVDEIARVRGLAGSTIESHLALCVKSGELSVFSLLPEQKIKAILEILKNTDDPGVSSVKHQMGDDYSFSDIRAVFNHWILLNSPKE